MTPIHADALPNQAPRSTADERAARVVESNLVALARTQPRFAAVVRRQDAGVQWVFARDGSVSCLDESGRWWAGCSLPRRAGSAMLRRLEVPGVVGCLLAPGHSGEIVAALEKLTPAQAVLVVQPDLRSLRVALGCEDFAADIAAHRLWFAWGEAWEAELASLFDEQPGLPTPERFIRSPALAEETAARLIPAAEAVLAAVGARRAARVAELRSRRLFPDARPAARKSLSAARAFCLVARSRFRLWDDSGAALAGVFRPCGGDAVIHLDPDDPASTSVLALAQAASGADAVVSAGATRAQLPNVVPPTCPVLTWVTVPAIPAFDPHFPADGLLLADAEWMPRARAAGWPPDRLRVAAWPATPAARGDTAACQTGSGQRTLGILVDTWSLDTPKQDLDLSSHHILWEAIRTELLADPFRLGADVGQYLARQRQNLGISEEGFSADWFIERLLLPAYQQGIARALLTAGLPLALYGNGWGELTEFNQAWGGRVPTREAFHEAVAATTAVVYPWPLRYAHQLDMVGRPILTPGRQAHQFLRQAKTMLAGESFPASHTAPPLSLATIGELLRH